MGRARTRANFPKMKVRSAERRRQAGWEAFWAEHPVSPWFLPGVGSMSYAEFVSRLIMARQAQIWKLPDDPLDPFDVSGWAALDLTANPDSSGIV